MENIINSHRDLIVWQKSMDLVIEVYKITKTFPQSEIYGIISQMKRCAVSIPSNIAEGENQGSKKSFRRFLLIAFGSGAELETQIEICKRLGFLQATECEKFDSLLLEIMKMLNKLISKLAPST